MYLGSGPRQKERIALKTTLTKWFVLVVSIYFYVTAPFLNSVYIGSLFCQRYGNFAQGTCQFLLNDEDKVPRAVKVKSGQLFFNIVWGWSRECICGCDHHRRPWAWVNLPFLDDQRVYFFLLSWTGCLSGLICYDDALVRRPVELPGSMANNSMKMVHVDFGQEIIGQMVVFGRLLEVYWKTSTVWECKDCLGIWLYGSLILGRLSCTSVGYWI